MLAVKEKPTIFPGQYGEDFVANRKKTGGL
jgi:hypothetical protein